MSLAVHFSELQFDLHFTESVSITCSLLPIQALAMASVVSITLNRFRDKTPIIPVSNLKSFAATERHLASNATI